MSERFSILQKSQDNMYREGSPIIVSATALLKDTVTDNIITQIKFLNISESTIKAVKVSIKAFDVTGKSVEGIDDYQYLDLNAEKGDYFGSNKAIVMPNATARSVQIDKILVISNNGEYFIQGDELLPLDKQEMLSVALKHPEIIKQYQIETTHQAKYVPKESSDLWLCTCGNPNAGSACTHCNTRKDTVFGALNTQKLKSHSQLRLAEQAKEADVSRQKEEAAIAAQNKKKRTKKSILLAAIVCIVAIFIGNTIIQSVKDKKLYEAEIAAIEAYITDGEYELAFDQVRNSDIDHSEKEEFYEVIIPGMRAARDEVKNSSKEHLAVVIDGVEIYVADYDIYRIDKNGRKTTLYTVPDFISIAGFYGYSYLSPRRSMYANGYLFFVECEESRSSSSGKAYYDYTARYIDIETGKVETIGHGDGFSDIVRLNNGTIFVGFDLLHPNDGIVFNPYSGSIYEDEDAVSDYELENAIYY